MPNIQLGNTYFDYIQQKQKRKTITIALKNAGQILIKTPHNISAKEACDILQRYADWIKEKNQAYEKLSQQAPINDNYILYRGRKINISRIFSPTYPAVQLIDDHINIYYPSSLLLPLAEIFLPWYKMQARLYLTERTIFWAEKLQVNPANISVKDQKSRWGSCSSLKNLNYNWRIMMAPDNIIDYLIVHELSHLKEMNHSVKFWSIVAQYDPSYKKHRLWLKHNGDLLLHVLRN